MRVLLAVAVAVLSSCGDDQDPESSTPPNDSGAIAVDTSMTDSAMSEAASEVSADVATGEDVPSEAAALNAFLQARKYAAFRAESAVHPSSGPHGKVRTFVNRALAQSLDAASAQHPIGAGSIKELYGADGTTLTGWAVEVKVRADSDAGKGWYWYEVFSVMPGASPVVDATGAPGCTGCHGSGARDYFKSPWPLP